MTKRVFLLHIPVYFLAIWGLTIIYLLITLPASDRSHISITDGNVVYTHLDAGLCVNNIVDGLQSMAKGELISIQDSLNRGDTPRQLGIWIYISPQKCEPNAVIYLDYIFPCQVCQRDDIFDLCRKNIIYDLDSKIFREAGQFWRKSVTLSNYLVPASNLNPEYEDESRAIYGN